MFVYVSRFWRTPVVWFPGAGGQVAWAVISIPGSSLCTLHCCQCLILSGCNWSCLVRVDSCSPLKTIRLIWMCLGFLLTRHSSCEYGWFSGFSCTPQISRSQTYKGTARIKCSPPWGNASFIFLERAYFSIYISDEVLLCSPGCSRSHNLLSQLWGCWESQASPLLNISYTLISTFCKALTATSRYLEFILLYDSKCTISG